MNKEDLRIVYLGTPEFAVEPLRTLVEGGYNVVGAVTMPDKPAGRGNKIRYSPVKEYALQQGIPLLQPERLKDPAFIEQLKAWQADIQIVVAFRMLPEVVWDMPRLGTFNLHASLLPQYRGAAPINRAIMSGETETGVTTFFLTHEIDTGNIIAQEKTPISNSDDAGSLHDRLMLIGAELVRKTIDQVIDQTIKTIPQSEINADNNSLKTAPKIFKEDCRIDWTRPARELHNFIRGLAPYPAAYTELLSSSGETISLKVFQSEAIEEKHAYPVGHLLTDNKSYLRIATPDGFIDIKSLQIAGKKRMPAADFLRGNVALREWRMEN